ncbi:unnamed protein product [Ascophyllum nodosum]
MVRWKDVLAISASSIWYNIITVDAFAGFGSPRSASVWDCILWRSSFRERAGSKKGDRLCHRRPRESSYFLSPIPVAIGPSCSTRIFLSRGAGSNRGNFGDEDAGESRDDESGSERAGEGEGDGEKITEEEMSGLYSRISAMREREVEIDRVCAYNWRRGTCSHDLLFQAADPIQHLAWTGDELAFGTSGGGNWIIDRSTGFVRNVFEGHSGDVTALCFDGELLVTGGSDSTVRVQRNARDNLEDEQLGECLYVLEGHKEHVTGVARLDGRRLASCSSDGTLRVWDLNTGKTLHDIDLTSPANCLGAAEGYLVTGLMDGSVVAWQAKNVLSAPTEILSIGAHEGGVTALSFPRQDVLLTGGGDGRVKFWDLDNGGAPAGNRYDVGGDSIIHAFKGHAGPVRAVQGDDHRLVSAGAEGTVSVWDLRSGQELFQIYGHYGGIRSLQFDREGLITDGTGESLYLHDFTGRRGAPAVIGSDNPLGSGGAGGGSAFRIGGGASAEGSGSEGDGGRSSGSDDPPGSDESGFRTRRG